MCHVQADVFLTGDGFFPNLQQNVGHSDVIMGAVLLNDDDLAARLRFFQNGKSVLMHFNPLISCNRHLLGKQFMDNELENKKLSVLVLSFFKMNFV